MHKTRRPLPDSAEGVVAGLMAAAAIAALVAAAVVAFAGAVFSTVSSLLGS